MTEKETLQSALADARSELVSWKEITIQEFGFNPGDLQRRFFPVR